MSTATAPTEDKPLVSQPDTSFLFASIRSALRLVIEPEEQIYGPNGRATGRMEPGVTARFTEGQLRVPHDRNATVRLEKGTIKAGDLYDFLTVHPLFEDTTDGFVLVDQSKSAPPPSDSELDALQRMALELDADGLRTLIEQEQAGWARPQLIEAAQGTLERIEAALDKRQAEIDAARAEGRKEAGE